MHTVLWKRLDQAGHDACRYSETGDTWNIEGSAVFKSDGCAANLGYNLVCDSRWRSLQASVTGWVGTRQIELFVDRDGAGCWRINGSIREDLAGAEDIDLGFTPATNTIAIHRLRLNIGDEAESTAVWLDTEDWTVKPLTQIYRRIGTNAYDYASPLHGYRAMLETDDFGAISTSPELWVMVR